MFFAGIDIGSTITKVVVRNEKEIISTLIRPTGAEHRRMAHEAVLETLQKVNLGFEEVDYIIATGYGRINVPFADAQISEITCHMRGVNWIFPGVKTIIDVGGQDCKGIKVENGKMKNFIMNDKCAAGTGRFLEIIADTLGLALEDIGEISLRSKKPAEISKTCTIFAEQEILLRLSEGCAIEDILAGLHKALANRIYTMVGKIKIEKEVVLTGGGAKNQGLRKWLEEKIGYPVLVAEEPLLTGALGAAVLAQEKAGKMSDQDLAEMKKNRKLEAVTFFKEDSTSNPGA